MDPLKLKLIELLTRDIKVRKDDKGQLIIETGIYEWVDGSWRDGEDPALGEDWPSE